MRIIDQLAGDPPRLEQKFWRRARITIGVVLLLICAFFVLLLVYLTPRIMFRDPELYMSADRLIVRTRNLCILLGVAYLATNLLSAPKYPILFLRRFGLDVNSVVSRVIKAGLGRRFRFVALDDSRFPPINVPAAERWLSRLGPPVIAVAVLGASAALLSRFSTMPDIGGNLTIETSNMMGYWASVICGLLVLALTHLYRVRHHSRRNVRNQRSLQVLLYEIRKLSKWPFRLSLMAPQTIIARVDDSLWQQTVSAALDQTPAVLIDVSDPTASLQWEIEQLRKSSHKCVFIAERDHLCLWTERSSRDSEAQSSIMNLVGNDEVLTYSAQSKLGGPAFRQSLKLALSRAICGAPKPRFPQPLPVIWRLWRISKSALFYACLS